MSNLKNIIEQFTINNTVHGLARLLFEQEDKRPCPCLNLPEASEDEEIKDSSGSWQKLPLAIDWQWEGKGEKEDE